MSENINPKNERLLRLPEVLAIFPVSRSTWYLGMARGIYPKPVKIGTRAAAWRQSDIEKLISDCASSG